jgi:hypothetical protein
MLPPPPSSPPRSRLASPAARTIQTVMSAMLCCRGASTSRDRPRWLPQQASRGDPGVDPIVPAGAGGRANVHRRADMAPRLEVHQTPAHHDQVREGGLWIRGSSTSCPPRWPRGRVPRHEQDQALAHQITPTDHHFINRQVSGHHPIKPKPLVFSFPWLFLIQSNFSGLV